MSAAKGFCFGWGVPLVPVPTLVALAHRFPGEGRIVCPVQDARRGEVYAALFRWVGGELERLSPDMAIAPALLPGRIPDGDVLFCGDGVAPFESLFREALGDRAILASGDEGHPRASAVGIVGERIFRDGGGEDPRTAVPFYLRSPGTEFPDPRP
jgi:tRNA threonylcarbamoyladenosine biosynthesis protein TsaB